MAEEGMNPFAGGPFIRLAALCEKVLREADGVLSLIRVVDIITQRVSGPDAPDHMPDLRVPLFLVVVLTPDSVLGAHDITIIPQLPSGETMKPDRKPPDGGRNARRNNDRGSGFDLHDVGAVLVPGQIRWN
jgi:hypothetical protein